MKKLFSLLAFAAIVSINVSFAQTTDNKTTAAPSTEQSVNKDAANTHSCCTMHGGVTKTDAATSNQGATSNAEAKKAETKHEHAGKSKDCDPAHCTDADKKACAKAGGKSCCQGMATTEEKKETNPKK